MKLRPQHYSITCVSNKLPIFFPMLFVSYVTNGISLYPDDEVYLAEEDLRNEYVLNDDGVVYAGWSRRTGPNPARWNFGQVC